MDIFNRFGEELANMGSEFVRLTKDASDTAKQHAIIVSENGKINEQFRLIGEVLFKKFRDDAEVMEILGSEFSECFERIQDAKERIVFAKDNIAQNKGGFVCPDCGNIVTKDSSFCNKCGKMM